MDARPVVTLMERNMAGHFSCLQRATEGMNVEEHGGCLLVSSGLPCDFFNVLFCRGRPSEPALQDAVDFFRARRLPFSTWVRTGSPANPVLERLGLRPTEAEIGMVLTPADFLPAEPPAGLTVQPVTDPKRLADFASVVAGDTPDDSVGRFYEKVGHAVLRADSPVRLFVGYWGGEPVATAEAFLGGGVGGVYAVATRDSHRRRGVGRAMTSRAVREVFESGGEVAVLQSSPDGRGLYERLGFRAVCEFTVFQ